jgi:hypothetical protein
MGGRGMIVKQKKPTLTELKYKYCELTARAALLVIAQKFGAAYKRFTWAGCSYTVDQALQEIDDYLLDIPCGSFGVVIFGGGPPGHYHQFQGTLLTMVCDFVLFEYYTMHMTEEELLYK